MRRQLTVSSRALVVILVLSGVCTAHAQSVRDVSPPWLTRPQQPGPHMHGIEQTPEPVVAAPSPPQTIRVRTSGELDIDGKRVRLATIALPERTRLCPGDRGSWACGAAAYIAWVNFFRGADVRCQVNGGDATCSDGERPVDEALVLAGWALPLVPQGEALRSLEEEAKNRKAGIHGLHR